jgi:biopolymer transport protein TolR
MLYNRASSVKRICKIDVTAFASVMLVLVFTMMIAVILNWPHHGAGVDLPRVWHPIEMRGANREDAIIVGISRDGRIYFDNERVAAEELLPKITEQLGHGAERKVYIKADRHVGYGTVSAVLDGVRSSGVEKIAFLVEQRTVQAVGRP